MNINELTIGEAKLIASMFPAVNQNIAESTIGSNINRMIGQKVIIRTYSAGVWFGVLVEKDGKEVILSNARRMYQWWCKEGISLSAVSIYGLNIAKSQIIEAVTSVWLEAIEIIPCSETAIKDLEEAPNVKAK